MWGQNLPFPIALALVYAAPCTTLQSRDLTAFCIWCFQHPAVVNKTSNVQCCIDPLNMLMLMMLVAVIASTGTVSEDVRRRR